MKNEYKIAICAIGYNRQLSLARLLNSLKASYYSQSVPLIISLDNCGKMSVKEFADSFEWNHGEKKVILQDHNLGLRQHVLKCGSYMEEYNLDAIIVLEDDITVSPFFFDYVTSCLEKYNDDDRIAGFSLYNFPISYVSALPFSPVKSEYDIYFMNCAMSWGQVWTKKKWRRFMSWYESHNDDFNISTLPMPLNMWPKSSWLKYHTRYCIENNLYFVYPYQALSTNNNDAGTHSEQQVNYFQSSLQVLPKAIWKLPSFDECFIKYDGFFEPKFLSKYLDVVDEDLTVNIQGKKTGCKTRYLLTMDSCPYKIVKSFSLKYKPVEANIILDNQGADIFLYDTTQTGVPPRALSNISKHKYYYNNSYNRLMNGQALKKIVQDYCSASFKRLLNHG